MNQDEIRDMETMLREFDALRYRDWETEGSCIS